MIYFVLGVLIAYGLLVTLALRAVFRFAARHYQAEHRLRRQLQSLSESRGERDEVVEIVKGIMRHAPSAPMPPPPPENQIVIVPGPRGEPLPLPLHVFQKVMASKQRLQEMVKNPYVGPLLDKTRMQLFDEEVVYDFYPDYKTQAEALDDGLLNPKRFMLWLHHHLTEAGHPESEPAVKEIRMWIDTSP